MKTKPRRKIKVIVVGSAARKTKTLPDVISHLQFAKVRRPKFADTLRFPENITELTAQNVSELIGKYTLLITLAMQDMSELNREGIRLDALERLRRQEIVMENPRINTIEKHKKEAFYDSDHRMRQIQVERTVISRRKEHTGMFLFNFDKYIVALSRELTRKSTIEEKGRRATASHWS